MHAPRDVRGIGTATGKVKDCGTSEPQTSPHTSMNMDAVA